jgi:uncharacterized protein YjlB
MKLKRPHLRDNIRTLEKDGFTVLEVLPTGSGHIKMVIRKEAVQFFIICPYSPGDMMRYQKNMRSQARLMYEQRKGKAGPLIAQ